MAAVKALALLVLASCARFDPGEPIQLIPAESWTTAEVETLRAAGDCWTLAFGIEYEIRDRPTTAQAVYVDYNEFVCWSAMGRFTPGEPAHIGVCPIEHWSIPTETFRAPLFAVLVHELGHANSIRVEGHDASSVMGGNQMALIGLPESHTFSDEDRRLLHEASPDFEPAPQCEIVGLQTDPVTGVACKCR